MLEDDDRYDAQAERGEQERVAGSPKRLDDAVACRELEAVERFALRGEIGEGIGKKVVRSGREVKAKLVASETAAMITMSIRLRLRISLSLS